MSAVSVTSSKLEERQRSHQKLQLELEALRAMNRTLRKYLERLRTYKRNIHNMNDGCKQLREVQESWVDRLRKI